MVAIGRGLMSEPTLLMLDEPSLGLAPKIVEMIFQILVDISHKGTTILLNEQNAQIALQIAHRAYVMETGRISLEGEASDLIQNGLKKLKEIEQNLEMTFLYNFFISVWLFCSFKCCERHQMYFIWK